MTIIRIEHSFDYTCISNKTLRDKHLSFKARGLHHLLLSYPNNWTVNIDHLVAESDKDGRAAVMSALNELQEHGYMTMRRVRSEQTGKFIGWEKVIRETPIPQAEAISTEVRKSDVGSTEVRKTALRINRKMDKPPDGKLDYIINTDPNKYLNQEVLISPLPPSGEMCMSTAQKKLNFSQSKVSSTASLEKQPQQSNLFGKEADRINTHPLTSHQERAQALGEQATNHSWGKSSAPIASGENSCTRQSIQTALPLVETEVLPDPEPMGISQASDRELHQERSTRDRFHYNQPQLSKNLDGSDRLPWETQHRGKFDPQFEKWMARSLMQYPAFQNLMAGELLIKVRKHISAGKYDLKRCDELFIEWEAMYSGIDVGEEACGITAKAASRRAKIRSALCN